MEERTRSAEGVRRKVRRSRLPTTVCGRGDGKGHVCMVDDGEERLARRGGLRAEEQLQMGDCAVGEVQHVGDLYVATPHDFDLSTPRKRCADGAGCFG